jgi:hypothetical protein
MADLSDERLLQMIDAARFYIGANGYDPDPEEIIALITELQRRRSAPEREAIVEECATVAEDFLDSAAVDIAAAIRALSPIEQDQEGEGKPVAWRARVKPFGQSGWLYADTEEELINSGHHNRQPLYAAPVRAREEMP